MVKKLQVIGCLPDKMLNSCEIVTALLCLSSFGVVCWQDSKMSLWNTNLRIRLESYDPPPPLSDQRVSVSGTKESRSVISVTSDKMCRAADKSAFIQFWSSLDQATCWRICWRALVCRRLRESDASDGALAFSHRQNHCFAPRDRRTSTMMTRSTSTMLRLKQRLATTRKQRRYCTLSKNIYIYIIKKNFIESFELLGFLTTVIPLFFFSIFCWFRMKSSRMTMFISAGWHDVVRIKIFTWDQFTHLAKFHGMTLHSFQHQMATHTYIIRLITWSC